MEDWKGALNYVSHHGVENPESTAIPLRIVTNSSLNSMGTGISYNSLLCKGLNSITPLVQVLHTTHAIPEISWDEILPDEFPDSWQEMFMSMVRTKPFMFLRSVNPEVSQSMLLLGFFDGANPAYGCCLYCVWEKDDKGHVSHLLAGKSWINTGKNLSTPRSEMNGLIMLV